MTLSLKLAVSHTKSTRKSVYSHQQACADQLIQIDIPNRNHKRYDQQDNPNDEHNGIAEENVRGRASAEIGVEDEGYDVEGDCEDAEYYEDYAPDSARKSVDRTWQCLEVVVLSDLQQCGFVVTLCVIIAIGP